ncbi:MAG: DUF1028 domain-containing protein [Kaiparowitsia implicata GSE-PSE-MK54-09C]|jgi:uncharacterized Ntn-hydrolase superfamily protein|nr:DUF1028 domain-containing protein [Kaiparowitsia implicata GSE-PSE-MK54-09C]
MTFSIVAWDPMTGMTGVAVATKHLAVGALVPHVKAGIGAIATQGQTNPLLGLVGLRYLEQCAGSRSEIPLDEVLRRLMQPDPDREQRQIHLVDSHGQTAAWTGADCVGWAGHLTFLNMSVAGNMLAGEGVLVAMADIYISHHELALGDRLLTALEAGDAAGGDKRGRQSAAVRVMHRDEYPHLDLRVDHHDQPIKALRQLYTESQKDYYQSFRQSMPHQRHASVEAAWLSSLSQSHGAVSLPLNGAINGSVNSIVPLADERSHPTAR